ncbi:SDR family oxidoreductase [Rhizobium lentis]|uniref:SDR family oxidoreductase n=1 Tax=Rhizobium lentis TaxID=1138194 RepID=UPI001C83280C|nr:SDR family oxidoreductase [Rhizobium lentis]MBX5039107.1 SDR family oxidoreductase [Rhizobium lentis]MBX5056448.1 SDR family oxidoreductase [Rhizobium lentis]MBX5069961.1 SDR family oxidoreductase [Rhizobium lentis]MBX5111363.1 SDR family oxidoreductase [Rhizobium lentis]MBX5114347.1 SDR family oxidoreductase [Rhizobium lentis]
MNDLSNSRRTFLALAATAPAAVAFATAATAQSSDAQPPTSSRAGRAAIITGSSRGIGAATARRLARDGFAVTVNYLTNRELAEAVANEIKASGGRAIVRQGDVSDPAAVGALFDASDEAFGGVDVVISNAGIMNVGSFAQMSDDAFNRMIATNLTGSFNVLREAARRVRDGGRIVTLSSSITLSNPAFTGAYAATKAAQTIYASVLSKELGGRNISVNAISPGAVDTQLLRQHGEEALRGIPERTPLRRLGQPEDIAGVIASLCAGDGAWINGQNVFANGGLS